MADALREATETTTYCSPNVKHLCRMDLGGAGQVTVEGNYAYLGYMYGPEGTTILEDRKSTRLNSSHLTCI